MKNERKRQKAREKHNRKRKQNKMKQKPTLTKVSSTSNEAKLGQQLAGLKNEIEKVESYLNQSAQQYANAYVTFATQAALSLVGKAEDGDVVKRALAITQDLHDSLNTFKDSLLDTYSADPIMVEQLNILKAQFEELLKVNAPESLQEATAETPEPQRQVPLDNQPEAV